MDAATIRVRLTPRAARDEIGEVRDGVLRVRVSAPPVDGRANAALCKLVAKRLGIAPSRVHVAHGVRGREKALRVEGADPAAVKRLTGG